MKNAMAVVVVAVLGTAAFVGMVVVVVLGTAAMVAVVVMVVLETAAMVAVRRGSVGKSGNVRGGCGEYWLLVTEVMMSWRWQLWPRRRRWSWCR